MSAEGTVASARCAYPILLPPSDDPRLSAAALFSADDCNGEGLFNNYCVHILARKPTMSAALMDKLLKASLALNLNTQNLPYNQTLQEGCW